MDRANPPFSLFAGVLRRYLDPMLGCLLAASLVPVLLAPSARATPRADSPDVRASLADSARVERAPRGFTIHGRLREALLAEREPGDARPIQLTLPVAGIGDVTLELRRFAGVSQDLRVELGAMKRGGSPQLAARLREVVHLEGTVVGSPNSSCYIALGATGVAGWLDLGADGGRFTVGSAVGDERGLHAGAVEFVRSAGTAAPDVPSCGGALCSGEDQGDGGVAGGAAAQPGVFKVARIAVDTDDDYFAIFAPAGAAAEEEAAEYAAALIGAVSAIYRRDASTSISLAYLRLAPVPSELFNEPDPLGPFRDYWNANGAGIDRDLFTLVTGRRNLPYGGVAWLSAACGSFGYSVNGYIIGAFADPVVTNPGNWDLNVTAHEFGHNLGTLHTHDYGIDSCASGGVQRGTIMSYCHVVQGASSNIDLRFHRVTAGIIRGYTASNACLRSDCDGDGVPDDAEIAANPALDANGDGIIDACQDCNGNGIADPVEIAAGALADLDGNLVPDACETDCDGDGIPDRREIEADPTLDANGDSVLDACEPDCDGDGVADSREINLDMKLDRSRDGRIDACEDCDGDGVADFTALEGSRSRWVASAADAFLRELDPRSGVVRRLVPCGMVPANDLAIGSDGRLYAATGNRVFALHRVNDAAAAPWSAALSATVRGIAVAPDGTLAALLSSGRVELLASDGRIARTLVAAGVAPDARDIVFRVNPDGSRDALVSHEGGVIGRISWPDGASSVVATAPSGSASLRGLYAFEDGSFLVISAAARRIDRYTAAGERVGPWSVEPGSLLNAPHSLCDAGDGRTVLATAASSSSTINGYNRASGYLERTYRVYPSDAPGATAIVVAPPSAVDADGNLVPDRCERVVGDLNRDGSVDASDLVLLLAAWGPCAGCEADLNGSGAVDASDIVMLIAAWG